MGSTDAWGICTEYLRYTKTYVSHIRISFSPHEVCDEMQSVVPQARARSAKRLVSLTPTASMCDEKIPIVICGKNEIYLTDVFLYDRDDIYYSAYIYTTLLLQFPHFLFTQSKPVILRINALSSK